MFPLLFFFLLCTGSKGDLLIQCIDVMLLEMRKGFFDYRWSAVKDLKNQTTTIED